MKSEIEIEFDILTQVKDIDKEFAKSLFVPRFTDQIINQLKLTNPTPEEESISTLVKSLNEKLVGTTDIKAYTEVRNELFKSVVEKFTHPVLPEFKEEPIPLIVPENDKGTLPPKPEGHHNQRDSPSIPEQLVDDKLLSSTNYNPPHVDHPVTHPQDLEVLVDAKPVRYELPGIHSIPPKADYPVNKPLQNLEELAGMSSDACSIVFNTRLAEILPLIKSSEDISKLIEKGKSFTPIEQSKILLFAKVAAIAACKINDDDKLIESCVKGFIEGIQTITTDKIDALSKRLDETYQQVYLPEVLAAKVAISNLRVGQSMTGDRAIKVTGKKLKDKQEKADKIDTQLSILARVPLGSRSANLEGLIKVAVSGTYNPLHTKSSTSKNKFELLTIFFSKKGNGSPLTEDHSNIAAAPVVTSASSGGQGPSSNYRQPISKTSGILDFLLFFGDAHRRSHYGYDHHHGIHNQHQQFNLQTEINSALAGLGNVTVFAGREAMRGLRAAQNATAAAGPLLEGAGHEVLAAASYVAVGAASVAREAAAMAPAAAEAGRAAARFAVGAVQVGVHAAAYVGPAIRTVAEVSIGCLGKKL